MLIALIVCRLLTICACILLLVCNVVSMSQYYWILLSIWLVRVIYSLLDICYWILDCVGCITLSFGILDCNNYILICYRCLLKLLCIWCVAWTCDNLCNFNSFNLYSYTQAVVSGLCCPSNGAGLLSPPGSSLRQTFCKKEIRCVYKCNFSFR